MNKREFFKLAENPPESAEKAPSSRTKADWKELAEHYKRVAEAGRDIIRREEERKRRERSKAPKTPPPPAETSLRKEIEDAAITVVAGSFSLAMQALSEALKKVAGKENDLSPHAEMIKERIERTAKKMKDHGAEG